MLAIDLLLTRSSQPRLEAPAPSGDALNNIIQAGLRAPDHKCLSPWRFVVCQGQGLIKLGQIFEQAAKLNNEDEKVITRAPQLPLRAPMVIVGICEYKACDGVPRVEQIASAACALSAMQMAAVAQGFQGIWRTGKYAQDQYVKNAFDCAEQDEIMGFLYLGTSCLKTMQKPAKSQNGFVQYWD
ncbi:NAD(P)H nitroreductase [Agaribacter flavus]|uniref:Putative NAD(P)H nitroreductase n=1 Tax=Agaribacter flavus TaxID=1902781 RepID=A0ABV7FMD2_9ALTE